MFKLYYIASLNPQFYQLGAESGKVTEHFRKCFNVFLYNGAPTVTKPRKKWFCRDLAGLIRVCDSARSTQGNTDRLVSVLRKSAIFGQ